MAAASHDPSGHRVRPEWAAALDSYAKPHVGRVLLDLATSVVPYLALFVVMYQLLDVSYWLVLAVAIPASGFLLRTFILFHDATHGSLFQSRRVNNWSGIVLGLFVMQPFQNWRLHHVAHHGSAGDLDRRGAGDVPTLTVAEYQSKPLRGRIGYWLFRHPLVMFGVGPLWSLVIGPRLLPGSATRQMRRSVLWTNAALVVLVGALCFLIGWREFLLVQMPMVMLAGTAGVFLFYVQHQYEDVYWESSEKWSYEDAALEGSSYLKLPQPFQFFTGNIGLHHVHHLNARIPNYNLQSAHDDNEIFHTVPVLTFWGGLKATRLKLWDPQQGRLVTFADARRQRRASRSAPKPVAAGSR